MYSTTESVVVAHQRCPACEKAGQDRTGDNLAVYSDGHMYCFACGHWVRSPHSLANVRRRIQEKESHDGLVAPTYTNLQSIQVGFSREIPHDATVWLRKYGLHDCSSLFCYHHPKQLLVYPVFDGTRLVYFSGRYFGPDPKHPKYYGVGNKTEATKLHIQRSRTNRSILCFVEDVVSAIRIQRGGTYAGIPLFGTSIDATAFLLTPPLPRDTIIRVWLDRDKASLAVQHAARLRQWYNDTASIITDYDPKCYSDTEIRRFIENTLDKGKS